MPQPVPGMNDEEDIFTQIRRGDILLHHPYMTFDPVVQFVKQAASRSGCAGDQTDAVPGQRPFTDRCSACTGGGKWQTGFGAGRAESHALMRKTILSGQKCWKRQAAMLFTVCVGLKTHSKITLVVRREEDGIRRYVHLGTGNYNDSTAKLYTDCGILTCSEPIGEDATAVFNMLSGYSEPKNWNRLVLATTVAARHVYAV